MGAVTTATFALRNSDKAMHGEGLRGGVAAAQFVNVTDMLRGGSGQVGQYAQSIFDSIDNVAQASLGVSNAATKLASFTSKAVNPLLCVASGMRVLKDEDKDKAFTEEVCAMGAMFGAEKIAKIARNAADNAIKTGSLDDIIKNPTIKNFGENLISKINGMSKGGKTALFIAAELLFVGISIAAFNNGKKLGQLLTGRSETGQTEKQAGKT